MQCAADADAATCRGSESVPTWRSHLDGLPSHMRPYHVPAPRDGVPWRGRTDSDLHPAPLPNRFLTPAAVAPPPAAYLRASAVFVHIHKCGGITMRAVIQRACDAGDGGDGASPYHCALGVVGPSRVRREHHPSRRLARHTLGGYVWGACQPERDGANCGYAVVLRHPVARMVSDYNYCTRSWSVAHAHLQAGNRGDYLCTSLVRRYLSNATADAQPTLVEWARARGNHMLELLSLRPVDVAWGAGAAPPRTVAEPGTWTVVEHRREASGGGVGEVELQAVVDALPHVFAVVGLTERMAESLLLWHRTFGGPSVDTDLRKNAAPRGSPGRAELPADVRAQVEEAVALDLRLYRAAEALFERQVAAVRAGGGELAERLAAVGR